MSKTKEFETQLNFCPHVTSCAALTFVPFIFSLILLSSVWKLAQVFSLNFSSRSKCVCAHLWASHCRACTENNCKSSRSIWSASCHSRFCRRRSVCWTCCSRRIHRPSTWCAAHRIRRRAPQPTIRRRGISTTRPYTTTSKRFSLSSVCQHQLCSGKKFNIFNFNCQIRI